METFYRWEDGNRGLEHKCGVCQTPLNSPRAKKTCFGLHQEVCTRYHKTLHMLGQSHHCDACHKSLELHDKRHRQIIKLIHSIHQLDSALEERTVETRNRKDANHRSVSSKNDIADANQRKISKASRKTAKHRAAIDVVTDAELERLSSVLHPEQVLKADQRRQNAQGLANNVTIEGNIAFNASVNRGRNVGKMPLSMTKQTHENKTQKNVIPDLNPLRLDHILIKLGVDARPAHASKVRKNLDSQLRNSIAYDIEVLIREEEQTMTRMAGYWRYVNRRTYNAMVRKNELWDWSTGEKLPEIEEEADGDDVVVDEDLLAAPAHDQDANAPAFDPQHQALDVPENWNDDDSQSSDDVPELTFSEESSVIESHPEKDQLEFALENVAVQQDSKESDMNAMPLGHLTYSPRRAPGLTVTFTVTSPSSSNDRLSLRQLRGHDLDTAAASGDIDQNNRFGFLKNEVPAPDETKIC